MSSHPVIYLIDKQETRSNRGMLSKAWYLINGEVCLVKGNSFGIVGQPGYEPFSEVMAYRIAKLLGIPHIEYKLMRADLFPEITNKNCEYVSVCRNFLSDDSKDMTISFYKYLIGKSLVREKIDVFDEAVKAVGKDFVFQLILLDAVIGNEDRHLNNIDFRVKKNGDEFAFIPAPIFDSGASLLAWQGDYDIKEAYREYRFDKAKPFRTTHKVAVKLIDHNIISNYTDTDVLYKDIIDSIADILDLLPVNRASAIRKYLRWRMGYVRRVLEQ